MLLLVLVLLLLLVLFLCKLEFVQRLYLQPMLLLLVMLMLMAVPAALLLPRVARGCPHGAKHRRSATHMRARICEGTRKAGIRLRGAGHG